MFYYLDTETMYGAQRHIMQKLDDGGVRSFPLTPDNPNTSAYEAWLAEGNTAEPWEAE